MPSFKRRIWCNFRAAGWHRSHNSDPSMTVLSDSLDATQICNVLCAHKPDRFGKLHSFCLVAHEWRWCTQQSKKITAISFELTAVLCILLREFHMKGFAERESLLPPVFLAGSSLLESPISGSLTWVPSNHFIVRLQCFRTTHRSLSSPSNHNNVPEQSINQGTNINLTLAILITVGEVVFYCSPTNHISCYVKQ